MTKKPLSLPVKDFFSTISSALVSCSDVAMAVVLDELTSNGDVEAAT